VALFISGLGAIVPYIVEKYVCYIILYFHLKKDVLYILVSPSSPKSEKLVPYILLLAIVVIGLQNLCTKMEVGAGLELYVY
jgi:hypothetical protein